MNRFQSFAKTPYLDRMILVFSGLLVLLVCGKALLNPNIPYDSWAYHLPFSSYIWDIGGGQSTYQPGDVVQGRFAGFPKMGETLQGFFWKISGFLPLVTLPHLLLFFAYLFAAKQILKVPKRYLVMGVLACPMLLGHFICTYIDLIGGLSVSLAFVLALHLIHRIGEGASGRSVFVWFALALVLASQVKLTYWISSMLLLGGLAAFCLFRHRARLTFGGVIAFSIVVLLSNANTIKNSVIHHNPFYPVELRMGKLVILAGTLAENRADDAYRDPVHYLGHLNIQPLNFALSVTELDWTIRGVRKEYLIDSSQANQPLRDKYGEFAAGGWGEVFIFLNLAFLCLQFCRWRSLDEFQRIAILLLVGMGGVTSLIPMSYYLRYWLHFPVILASLNLRYLIGSAEKQLALILCLMAMFYGFVEVAVSSNQRPFDLKPQNYRSQVPAEEWSDSGTFRRRKYTNSEFGVTLFKYSHAVTGNKVIYVYEPPEEPETKQSGVPSTTSKSGF